MSTPGDCHSGHEVPVIEQGHVTPDIGERDTRLHAAWHQHAAEGKKRGELRELLERQQLCAQQSKPVTK